jgi:hypothetical protein
MTPVYYLGGQVNRSDWFDPPQQPWEPGIYECEWVLIGEGVVDAFFNRFDGVRWRYGSKGVESADALARSSHAPINLDKWRLVRWRGLAEKPQ